jgi:hypothetical protein
VGSNGRFPTEGLWDKDEVGQNIGYNGIEMWVRDGRFLLDVFGLLFSAVFLSNVFIYAIFVIRYYAYW